MTVNKKSHRADQVLQKARDIKVYSLSNSFTGQPLVERPEIWGEVLPGENYRQRVEVSQAGFLRHELANKSTKLIDNGNNHFTIDVHSNLWFTFRIVA